MSSSELDEFVDRVRERSDIREVVGNYVPLTFKAGRYWGCCPFHSEKTASFTVTPDKGLFYCFGCHVGGNVFNFLSKIENITYFEAIKLQAERLGIPIPVRNKSPEEMKVEQNKKTLLKINELARDFYHSRLTKGSQGESCRKYLVSRGITENVIKNFKLGFAPNSDELTKILIRRGFSYEQLEAAGLVQKSSYDDGFYEKMKGRMIIPINDIFGRVVAFGGRTLKNDADVAKYLNTKETAVFVKGKMLFGLDRANKKISAQDYAIVVEGYMDAISLASFGIENVVASLGTAFSEAQAKLLTRYTRRIIFCYDSDEAGQRATVRALPIVQQAGAEAFVIKVPEGKDPDEFIRRKGKSAFAKLIRNATPMIDYRIDFVLDHSKHDSYDEKVYTLHEILPLVAKIEDATLKNAYARKIATALFLDETSVKAEWEEFSTGSKQNENFSAGRFKIQEKSKLEQSIEVILRTSWGEVEIMDYVLSLVPREFFPEKYQEIIGYIERCYKEDRVPDDLDAAKELDEKSYAELSRILSPAASRFGVEEFVQQDSKAFTDSFEVIRQAWSKIHYEKLLTEFYATINDKNKSFDGELPKIAQLADKMFSLTKIED